MALKPLTVSQLNDYLDRIMRTDPILRQVIVRGEVSYVKYHPSGHVYLTVTDGSSKLSCIIYRSVAETVDTLISEGDDLVLTGSIGVYKEGGTYSRKVRTVALAGEGELAAAFQRMKQKLEKEGLFDRGHKKSLPSYPKHIGVVTSGTGAAVKDILSILTKRTPLTDVTVFSVPVQGQGAGAVIARVIDAINEERKDSIDLLIVGRGGGSPEDLAEFNSEELARAIYRSGIPVISAVGHEIDYSISDFVADMRAETPTAAAQMAVRDAKDIRDELEAIKMDMTGSLNTRLLRANLSISGITETMERVLRQKIDSCAHEAERYAISLKENDPRRLLSRGFAFVGKEDGRPVSGAAELRTDERYRITFADGYGIAVFDEINVREENTDDSRD